MKSLLCRHRLKLSFAVFLTLAIAVQSQTPTTESHLADLQWFSGHWSCDGKFAKSGKSISADLIFEPILQGKWMLLRHDDRPPFSYHALSQWGWDDKGHQYISAVQDSTGGIRLFYSSGFTGSKLVWIGKSLENTAAPPEQFAFEKLGQNIFTVAYSFQQDGTWQAVDTSTCTRKPE